LHMSALVRREAPPSARAGGASRAARLAHQASRRAHHVLARGVRVPCNPHGSGAFLVLTVQFVIGLCIALMQRSTRLRYRPIILAAPKAKAAKRITATSRKNNAHRTAIVPLELATRGFRRTSRTVASATIHTVHSSKYFRLTASPARLPSPS
jgi:hypothetical protein